MTKTARVFRRFNNQQIKLAGPRYSPGLLPDAPNIEVAPIRLAIGSIAFDQVWRTHIGALASRLEQALDRSALPDLVSYEGRRRTPRAFLAALRLITGATADSAKPVYNALLRCARSAVPLLRAKSDDLQQERQQAATDSDERTRIGNSIATIQYIIAAIREAEDFLLSDTGRLAVNNRLLVLGEWGTGKTHLLCDVTRERAKRGQQTLLVLAQHLPARLPPLEAIADRLGGNRTLRQPGRSLDGAGKRSGSRSLVLIDGINGGDLATWRTQISALTRTAGDYQHVGFVLSCRTPFDDQVFVFRTRMRWCQVHHTGFQGIEFDAQLEYFTYYGIAAPQTPLLTPEFSIPLFLKLFCGNNL